MRKEQNPSQQAGVRRARRVKKLSAGKAVGGKGFVKKGVEGFGSFRKMLTERLPVQFNTQIGSIAPVSAQPQLAFQPKQQFGRTCEVFALAL